MRPIAGVLLLITGCGSDDGGAGRGEIEVRVESEPLCPENTELPCDPVGITTTVRLLRDGEEVARDVADGRAGVSFRVDAGSYVVLADPISRFPLCDEASVILAGGEREQVYVVCYEG